MTMLIAPFIVFVVFIGIIKVLSIIGRELDEFGNWKERMGLNEKKDNEA